MSDTESTALDVLTDAATHLPAPVKATFFKAVGHLLGGLTAIPAAKLNQYAQSIHDTTAARSALSAALTKAIASEGVSDPELMQAAAEVLLPGAVLKAKNRLLVAKSAAKEISLQNATQPPENNDQIDEDWLNTFGRFAENASSDRLQELFGRVLAGEATRPGSYGLTLLRVVSELDQQLAKDFSEAWAQSVGEEIDYSAEWQRGEGYERWKRLAEAGLMAATDSAQFPPPVKPALNGLSLWTPISIDLEHVNICFSEPLNIVWSHISFTRVGRQLGSLLEKPNYKENVRRAAMRLPRNGVLRIDLFSGSESEVIWEATY